MLSLKGLKIVLVMLWNKNKFIKLDLYQCNFKMMSFTNWQVIHASCEQQIATLDIMQLWHWTDLFELALVLWYLKSLNQTMLKGRECKCVMLSADYIRTIKSFLTSLVYLLWRRNLFNKKKSSIRAKDGLYANCCWIQNRCYICLHSYCTTIYLAHYRKVLWAKFPMKDITYNPLCSTEQVWGQNVQGS